MVGVPTRGFVHYQIASRLGKIEAQGYPVIYAQSSYGVEAARKKLCHYFLKGDAQFLMFIDDDIMAPTHIIDKLLMHNKDIVSASYLIYKDGIAEDSSGEDHFGLAKVERCGLGACLIKRKVIKECIGLDCFAMEYDSSGEVITGEDTQFCRCANVIGYDIYVDFDLRCDHMKTAALKGGMQ